MKSKSTFSLILLASVFASCTTAYKSGQTPDDVYYSPARPQEEYVHQEKKADKNRYEDEESYRDDRYLRMKIQDRRYSTLYDDYYSYNPYYYHYYNGNLIYNTPWSTYNYWNYYYNPYWSPVISVVPKNPVYNKPRTFDMSVYTPQPNNIYNPKGKVESYSAPNYNTGNTNNYRSSGRDAGSFLRDVFSGSSGGSGSSSNPSGTSRSSSSSSGSSGSSGSSSRGNASRGNN